MSETVKNLAHDIYIAMNDLYDELEDLELKKFTREALASAFGHNISRIGSFYDSENYRIFITNKATYKNWLYYAGFEYIEDNYEIYDSPNGFLAIFQEHSRVTDLIDLAEQLPKSLNERVNPHNGSGELGLDDEEDEVVVRPRRRRGGHR